MQFYHSRVKLETFFEGKKSQKEKRPFTHSSELTPSLARLPKQTTSIVRADLYAYKHLHWAMTEKQNLTVGEGKALNQLRNNRNIIKPADKGNAVVLMGKKDCLITSQR